MFRVIINTDCNEVMRPLPGVVNHKKRVKLCTCVKISDVVETRYLGKDQGLKKDFIERNIYWENLKKKIKGNSNMNTTVLSFISGVAAIFMAGFYCIKDFPNNFSAEIVNY